MKRTKTRTIILVSILVIMVFGVFIALPMLVPSYGDTNCNKVIKGCSKGTLPIWYETLIWKTDHWPLTADKQRYDIHPEPGFNVERVSENSSTLRVSGYLLYGTILHHENDPDDDLEDLVNVLPDFRYLGVLRYKLLTVEFREEFGGVTILQDTFTIDTGANGTFEFELETNDQADCYRILIFFDGETIVPYLNTDPMKTYWVSSAQESDCLGLLASEKRENRFWQWFGVGCGIIAVFVAGYSYRRYRRRRVKGNIASVPQPELVPDKVIPGPPLETGGDTNRLRLSFPDIEPELPPVWGTERDLTLSVAVVLPENETAETGEIRIDWGDDGGETDFTESHRYHRKGEYRITASFRSGRRTLSSWRMIRIVDYREEMVRIFGELVVALGLADISIAPETTPRELEKLLVEHLGSSYRTSIRTVVDGFEEANYSTHPVNRKSYLAMYRGIRGILGG